MIYDGIYFQQHMSVNLHFRRYFAIKPKVRNWLDAIHDMRVTLSKTDEPSITESSKEGSAPVTLH